MSRDVTATELEHPSNSNPVRNPEPHGEGAASSLPGPNPPLGPEQAEEEKTEPKPSPDPGEPKSLSGSQINVYFKPTDEKLLLILPSEHDTQLDWAELWGQIQQRLDAGERFWQSQTPVELIASDRLLDPRQLQQLVDGLGSAQLQLQRVHTTRRQTAIAAAAAGYAVEQPSIALPLQTHLSPPKTPLADPLYLETTVRSGTEIRHPGTVVIVGDLNPGSSVVADGDILVWGKLRGVAHAGAQGNPRCRIMALQIEATQLRIADQVARTPKPPAEAYPEVAYITPTGIRLARATDFNKNIFLPPQEAL
jgi:septum site-determining protein MinC